MNTVVKQLSLLIVVGVSCATVSSAADQPPFSITISSPQQAWKMGSDVTVTVILTNTSSVPVFFGKSFAQDEGELFMDVEVKDDKGNPLPRTKYYRVLRHEDAYDCERQANGECTLRVVGGGSVRKKFLKPNETATDGIVVSRLFDLSQPGKYTIRVQRRDESTKSLVTSTTITVRVSE